MNKSDIAAVRLVLAPFAQKGILVGTTEREGDVGYSSAVLSDPLNLPEGLRFYEAQSHAHSVHHAEVCAASGDPASALLGIAWLAAHASDEQFEKALEYWREVNIPADHPVYGDSQRPKRNLLRHRPTRRIGP